MEVTMPSGEEAQACSWCPFSEGSIISALGNPSDPIPMPACEEHWLCREGKLALPPLPAPTQLSLALHWDQRHLRSQHLIMELLQFRSPVPSFSRVQGEVTARLLSWYLESPSR